MRDKIVCSIPEEIEDASRGDYKVYKYKCKSLIQYGNNPYNVDHSTTHYQVRIGREVIETFSDLEDAEIHAGKLYTVELKQKAKDNADTKDIHTDTREV